MSAKPGMFRKKRGGGGGGDAADAVAAPPPKKKPAQASLASFGFKRADPGTGRADDGEAAATAAAVTGAPPAPPPAPASAAPAAHIDRATGLPLARDPAAHARWQRKLAADGGLGRRTRASADGEGGGPGAAGPSTTSARGATPPPPAGGQLKASPLEVQVAALQAANPGTVLAIEVGYKFTFFGRDAEVAASVLRTFAYTARNYLTTAVPVPALAKSVRRLVAAGHRVGVVRQVETAALKKSGATADGKGGPFARAVTAVYTAATLECGGEEDIGAVVDTAGAAGPSGSAPHLAPPASTFSLTVAADGVGGVGLAAVDAASGDAAWAALGAGEDGVVGLETALRRLEPVELVGVRPLPPPIDRALALYAGDRPGTRMDDDDGDGAETGPTEWLASFFGPPPAGGQADTADAAALAALPAPATVALAAALRRLRAAGLDGPLRALGPARGLRRLDPAGRLALSGATLDALDVLAPSRGGPPPSSSASASASTSPAPAASLLWLLDRTRTKGGRRALRDWVSRPLADVPSIDARLDAVEELVDLYGGGGGSGPPSPPSAGGGGSGAPAPAHNPLPLLGAALTRVSDLERGLARALHRTASPSEFVATMSALGGAAGELGLRPGGGDGDGAGALSTTVKSALLRRLLASVADPAAAAAAAAALAPLDVRAAAARPVNVVALLADGDAFPVTAAAKADLAAASAALDALLPALRTVAGVPSLAYVSIHNQGSHLLELPVGARPPADWVKVGGTKAKNRFLAPPVQRSLASLDIARERLAGAAAGEWKDHLAAAVAPAYGPLRACAAALAALDALLSLADAAAAEGWVRPTFLPVDEGLRSAADLAGATHRPALRFKGLVHPLLAAAARIGGGSGGSGGGGGRGGARSSAFTPARAVPNDLSLGGDGAGDGTRPPSPRALVITGPNMGGKSALARAAGLAVIMAHAGCFVPAAAAALTPVDAVFTRMGAADDLLRGRSTFHEELADAATILAHASPRSLAIVDELGRGTSTHDGAALAGAVLAHLAGVVEGGGGGGGGSVPAGPPGPGALTLFITHYSDIAREGGGAGGGAVAAAHMACLERPAGGGGGGGCDDASPSSTPHIIFLYRLVPGAAASSHGLNVARLAGLPEWVITRAAGAAARFQAEVEGGAGGRRLAAAARAAVAAVRGGAGLEAVKGLAGGAL